MVNRSRLMRFSMFLMAQFIPFKEALKCMEGEYEVDGQCCPTCQPGFRVHETCSIMTGTMCVPCDPGTYTAHHSGLKECLQCKVCDPELGLVTRRKCSPTSNTVCGCSPGHFCVIMKDVCEMCMPHRVCTTGQYVSSRGTERSNTICEKCQTGTFSPNGTLGQCLPWTNCTTHGLFEEKPGTDTTDALCSSKSDTQRRRFGIPVIVVIILMTIILGMKLFGRKKNQQVNLSHHGKICDTPEDYGSVINLPVKETKAQEESPTLWQRMSKSQDNGEP